MNIESMTVAELMKFMSVLNLSEKNVTAPWEIGKNYLIRTVTMTNTGRLVAVTENELVLEDAAWVADTGRFSDNVMSCEFSEVEPFPDGRRVIIGRGAVVDACVIARLPRHQK